MTLRRLWDDVDFDANIIDINHTCVMYRDYTHSAKENDKIMGNTMTMTIDFPKTKMSIREIPLNPSLRSCLIELKKYYQANNITCKESIAGFSDFVFIKPEGDIIPRDFLNRKIKHIIEDFNKEAEEKGSEMRIPYFTCHYFRHTFTTRAVEVNMNSKVLQTVLGHTRQVTTNQVYSHATSKFKASEMLKLENDMNKSSETEIPIHEKNATEDEEKKNCS